MKKVLNWFEKHKDYFYPAVIAFFVLLIAFLVKGVYPFGSAYTGLIDYEAGLVPSYTYLWDFLHGKESFLFNKDLGLGANMYASSVLNTFFSPLSYIVGIFARENVCYAIGFIVVIKMMLMATTSYIIFKKWFKNVDYKWICLFSLTWAFSSWLLVHISNVGWLDVMIIFPFLLDGIKDIVDKDKMTKFVICLTLSLIFSYYMSYMILIMMITLGISMVYTILDKEKKKKVIGQMFLGTLFSLFISMFAFLPSFLQSQASYRFQGDVKFAQSSAMYTKLAMLCFYGILLYFPIKMFVKYRGDKNVKCLMLFLLFTTMTVVVEPINKMWHTGSYFSYPYRFSYIPLFFMIISCLYYLEHYYNKEEKKEYKNYKYYPVIILSSVMMLVIYMMLIGINFYLNKHLAFNQSLIIGLLYVAPGILSLILIFALFRCLNKEKFKVSVICLTLVQILASTIGYMGHTGKKVEEVYNIKNNFDLANLDENYAIKDETYTLINNAPLLLEKKSMATWLHINSQYQTIHAISLGYGNSQTQISSYGGTYFSDMLSGNKYVLSLKQLGESAYTLLETKEIALGDSKSTVYLYEYKYTLPEALLLNKDIEVKEFELGNNAYDNQNYLYKTLFNKKNNIIEILAIDKNVETKEYDFDLNNEFLYLYGTSNEAYNYKVYINDEVIELKNMNGIVNLGMYNDGNIKVRVEAESALEEIQFATLNLSLIQELASEYDNDTRFKYNGNKIYLNINAENAGKVYIPVNYEEGSWSALVNNKKANVEKFVTTYIAIDVEKGNNVIELTFTPKMLKVGTVLTLVTLILVIVLYFINKKYAFFEKKKFTKAMFILGSVLGLALFAFVYVLPLTK